MKTFTQLSEWNEFRLRFEETSLGFVPTMGALHNGHISLVQRSLAENEVSAVSIYLNPTQFDKASDLATYPRQTGRDLAMLDEQGVDSVFMPQYAELYPDDFRYRVSESEFSHKLCGAHRPGHFDGMLTVVLKLLQIIRPQRAYFGEKDFQQLQLVRGMVQAFFLPVEIVGCPIVREEDGLALSSRNRHLDTDQRRRASDLFRILSGSTNSEQAKAQLKQRGFLVDYVEELCGRRMAAARLGSTRLIDNVPLD